MSSYSLNVRIRISRGASDIVGTNVRRHTCTFLDYASFSDGNVQMGELNVSRKATLQLLAYIGQKALHQMTLMNYSLYTEPIASGTMRSSIIANVTGFWSLQI